MNEALNLTVGNQTCQAGPFPLPKSMIPMFFFKYDFIVATGGSVILQKCYTGSFTTQRFQRSMTEAGWEFEDEHLQRLQ